MRKKRLVGIFGDVHGDNSRLLSLITGVVEEYGEDFKIEWYSVGDLVDRGPDTKGVIDTCLKYEIPAIVGNHELWFYRYIKTGEFDEGALHFMMGGAATIKSYVEGGAGVIDLRKPHVIQEELEKYIPQEHKDYILGSPLYRKVEVAGTTYWLIHAGIKEPTWARFAEDIRGAAEAKGLPREKVTDNLILDIIATVSPDSLLWDHYHQGDEMHAFEDGGVQVFGHAPLVEPVDEGHFIALDTGCGRKRGTTARPNKLSAVLLFPDGSRKLASTS